MVYGPALAVVTRLLARCTACGRSAIWWGATHRSTRGFLVSLLILEACPSCASGEPLVAGPPVRGPLAAAAAPGALTLVLVPRPGAKVTWLLSGVLAIYAAARWTSARAEVLPQERGLAYRVGIPFLAGVVWLLLVFLPLAVVAWLLGTF